MKLFLFRRLLVFASSAKGALTSFNAFERVQLFGVQAFGLVSRLSPLTVDILSGPAPPGIRFSPGEEPVHRARDSRNCGHNRRLFGKFSCSEVGGANVISHLRHQGWNSFLCLKQ